MTDLGVVLLLPTSTSPKAKLLGDMPKVAEAFVEVINSRAKSSLPTIERLLMSDITLW
ncbi:MAG: hypothetical protein N0C81_16140 [Candidatus Thiodiazotropha lotti]|uniref:Uncharacterized protein n=1 Tax=Candidatus Thiodiazotropha lotti TaxID=2792787 RepID=A0A9E4MY06_9GAMM|nr:hypothetical protein [Candidatus Thiodiazotropha lotti]MCG7929102.1 hypothetical protein [Candidatus Thiodiazotropha lotti]MCG7937351.1 hypothetical protein [Candidatus Thiodiazotropha lotti]MCG8004098.1 hypothetical protein [Candidatus Thiodiazotropha lotti]MCG8011876.1 hypothetical protein [Candidatus Thiodiazotropha lotti]